METPIGTRFSLNGFLGTIKYVGQVDNTTGSWLGVEWDNPTRGKHDGSKDGKQYFICRSKSAGSFIRATPHIQYGISFLEALSAKYVEALHGDQSQEVVVLGSSQGAIQVEAVDLDKIREKFSRLDRLREVSLDNANVVRGNQPGEIAKTCPNIRGLNLSQNLIPSWEVVSQIVSELPWLQRLSLNCNRLRMPTTVEHLTASFRNLTEIQLNDTSMDWADIQKITSCMPELRTIELGYNHISRLCGDKSLPVSNSAVEIINLDGNIISDWTHVCASLKEYKSLQRIILTSNNIESIPFPESASDCLPGIKYLSLSENNIKSWDTIDALSCWLPALKTLTMSGNPLLNVNELGQQSRAFLIARIPSLLILDGAPISTRERIDSELFYMSFIIHQGIASDEERCEHHYHWLNLCQKHGRPDELQKTRNMQNKLSDHLINLQLYRHESISHDQGTGTFKDLLETTIRVLPTMTLRILRLKICKALKLDARRTKIMLWLQMQHGSMSKLDIEHDSKNLDWLGVENGSQILYQVQ